MIRGCSLAAHPAYLLEYMQLILEMHYPHSLFDRCADDLID